MNGERFVVIVAEPGETIPIGTLRAFITNGKRGLTITAMSGTIRCLPMRRSPTFSPSIAQVPTTAWSAACRSRIA